MPAPSLLIPFVSYALLMSFTPGPNNISCSLLGLKQGYRASLPYLFGISAGFFAVMLLAGLLTEFFTQNYAVIAPWLKWIGVVYMTWLAVSLFLPSKKSTGRTSAFTFPGGFVLQFLNPKGVLYGITIYASFSSIVTGSLAKTLVSSFLLAVVCFLAVTTWSLVGSSLSRWFENPRFHLVFNVVMVLLLGYSVYSILAH
jgi:cysteine/O-acetylserine efflux protein